MPLKNTPSLEDRQATYQRDGFVVIREFLTGDELDELRAELDRYIRDVVPGLPKTSAFYQDPDNRQTLKQLQHMGVDPYFEQYRRHPAWKEAAESLVGETANSQEPEWFNKPPGVEHVTPPHQDNYYFCLRPANVATLWLALDPIDPENGCLRYVAGSHLKGIREHHRTSVLGFSQGIADFNDEDKAVERPIKLSPGDLVAHHGETIHRADPNRSLDRQRRAFAMVFRGVSCQLDEQAYQRYQTRLAEQHANFGIERQSEGA